MFLSFVDIECHFNVSLSHRTSQNFHGQTFHRNDNIVSAFFSFLYIYEELGGRGRGALINYFVHLCKPLTIISKSLCIMSLLTHILYIFKLMLITWRCRLLKQYDRQLWHDIILRKKKIILSVVFAVSRSFLYVNNTWVSALRFKSGRMRMRSRVRFVKVS